MRSVELTGAPFSDFLHNVCGLLVRPARDEATRSCQLRQPGHAHWRGTGAQMRKGGKTGWGEGDHDHRCL
eukprot:COSAG01_NODE_1805_length_9192_cov_13.807324_13_plen_70_part_00